MRTADPDDRTAAPPPVLLDVRTPAEFAGGHIDGALHLPLDQLQHAAPRLLPDLAQPLIVYCASGARSAFACAVLSQMGYRQAMNGGAMAQLATGLQRPLRAG
ncbi:rhodanese-like domain-containing protein [Ideonella sp. 4Y16]|uniref:rhodanese-like domain-containing protein n=1 Tax=Ideonella alba TaxID=2824118 RepID=UPI001B359FAE|nr:rhodanese-like domain-containing protein [Ideonella alba]MBQ0944905.1 rhodanese-like domain-containing protein [Ideonella alba]